VNPYLIFVLGMMAGGTAGVLVMAIFIGGRERG
jgi:hypothetical protein